MTLSKPEGIAYKGVAEKIVEQNNLSCVALSRKPFLKWVGGKRSIIAELEKRLPDNYAAYYEPFIGGGALFFHVQPDRAFLSDVNFHLIITYTAVRDDLEGLIAELKIHKAKHSPEYYLRARKRLSAEQNPTKIAGLVIYLNKTCFNGLYRVNKKGEFNVPIGDYKEPAILDEETLIADNQLLQGVRIEQKSFEHVKIKKGAFYYLDPPYHQTYSQYDGSGFGEKEHARLAEFCSAIDKEGGFFMLSNSDTDLVRKLYVGYNIEEILASRSVSCKSHQRGRENELIIRNY